jgi:hypothetical protein
LLIWLPEYANADYYWDLPNDNRDAGWIWVEATGDSNPLGWTPPDYESGGWIAHPIGDLEFVVEPMPSDTDSSSILPSIDMDFLILIIGVILAILGILLKARRR